MSAPTLLCTRSYPTFRSNPLTNLLLPSYIPAPILFHLHADKSLAYARHPEFQYKKPQFHGEGGREEGQSMTADSPQRYTPKSNTRNRIFSRVCTKNAWRTCVVMASTDTCYAATQY
eukprot:1611173-Rhodomonas_salina.2